MKTKYAMMVTLKEARSIYIKRAKKFRRKQGFASIIKSVRPPDMTKDHMRKIRDAVTLNSLDQEDIKIC